MDTAYDRAAEIIADQQIDEYLDPTFVISLTAKLEQALIEQVNSAEGDLDEDSFRAIVTRLQITSWLAGYLYGYQAGESATGSAPEPIVLSRDEAQRLVFGLARGDVTLRVVVWEE